MKARPPVLYTSPAKRRPFDRARGRSWPYAPSSERWPLDRGPVFAPAFSLSERSLVSFACSAFFSCLPLSYVPSLRVARVCGQPMSVPAPPFAWPCGRQRLAEPRVRASCLPPLPTHPFLTFVYVWFRRCMWPFLFYTDSLADACVRARLALISLPSLALASVAACGPR